MPEDSQIYTVVIGDVSGSKQLSGKHRYQTQLFIKSAIIQINEEYTGLIEAPLTITKGDEFQGLFRDLENAYKICLALEKATLPVQIRFGLGVGQIFKMGSRLPIEMDGAAFHAANDALQMAKKKKMSTALCSQDKQLDNLINTIFRLMSAIKQKWSERHHKLFWLYKDLGTYRKVAETEQITPQAVCDILKNCRALEIKKAEESLNNFFEEYKFTVNLLDTLVD
jgi:predicted DNA-binding protein YlxM (UPF0122 family)